MSYSVLLDNNILSWLFKDFNFHDITNEQQYTEIFKTYLKNYALITADYNKIFFSMGESIYMIRNNRTNTF